MIQKCSLACFSLGPEIICFGQILFLPWISHKISTVDRPIAGNIFRVGFAWGGGGVGGGGGLQEVSLIGTAQESSNPLRSRPASLFSINATKFLTKSEEDGGREIARLIAPLADYLR